MGLVHPVLMILFVYPVVGATIRLGILVREKRLNINPIADTVPVEHAQHGAWVTGGVLTAVLFGLGHSVAPLHLGRWLLMAAIVLVCFSACLNSRRLWRRLVGAGSSWCTLLVLGLAPEVERLSDRPWDPLFWQSHFWMGLLLSGLLLGSTTLQPAIARDMRIRRLHVGSNVLVGLLLAMQAISGCRNLLHAGLQTSIG
ncbi:MAG: DUF4079 family protein [Synechococcus sp.]